MKAEYKRDLQNNYLILEAPQEANADDYRFRMAEQNSIPGLLPFHSARKDGILYLHYEITSLQPLAGIFEKRTMGYDDILFLLTGIRDVLETLQRYLLDPSQLMFDPDYLYIDPDHRRVHFCYLPGNEESFPISMLAEFILKRLDHREQQAIELGYGFYQKATEENFSLQRALKEMLSMETGKNEPRETATFAGSAAEREFRYGTEQGRAYSYKESGHAGDLYGEDSETISEEDRETYEVTHHERKRRPTGKIEKLFQLIHPAVLLSTFFLLAVLEVVYYFGLLTLTEAGGIFFLLISVEALANRFWKASREKKQEDRWVEEEDDEAYRVLQEEMYDVSEQESVIEETRCLTPGQEQDGMRLVCTRGGASGIAGEDIILGTSPVYIGKIQGESDVILNSPTVSRRHARLECRDGVCYVKDLNSRNGTFCNGRRLHPQEQCRFGQGDEIAFAEISYRAVSR